MAWWWFVVGVAVLVVIDRLLLRAEARGWIFYRRRKPTGGVGGAVFGPMFDVLQPSRTVLVQEQQSRETRRVDESTGDKKNN